MGKTIDFQLSKPPSEPIVVLDRYETYYIEQLRRALRKEREAYSYGLPTFHRHLCNVVDRYASEIVDSSALSVKDLGNFLKGMKSQVVRLRILDAYVKIVAPESAKAFTPDGNRKRLTIALTDYLGMPELQVDPVLRSIVFNKLAGVYKLNTSNKEAERAGRITPRYLVLRISPDNSHLISYEFSDRLDGHAFGEARNQLRLMTGICLPQQKSCFVLSRNYADRRRQIGKIIYGMNKDESGDIGPLGELPLLTYFFFDSDGESTAFNTIRAFEARSKAIMPSRSDYWYRGDGIRVRDEFIIRKVDNIVDSFGDIF